MLLLDVINYLKSRIFPKEVSLSKKVDFSCDHEIRTVFPRVAIIIPTRDRVDLLRACVESITDKTTYPNFELIIIDNGSKNQNTKSYLNELFSRGISILRSDIKFNFSALCNLGATSTTAEYLCFLNNDTEVIEPRWLDYLVDHAIQNNAGVIGAKLLYRSGDIQHLGLALGSRGLAAHAYQGTKPSSIPEVTDLCFQVSGVTFACAMVSADKYTLLGGLDQRFRVGLNDVDFCKRSNENEFENILCGKSSLYHFESQSRDSVFSLRGGFRAGLEILRFLKIHGMPEDKYFD